MPRPFNPNRGGRRRHPLPEPQPCGKVGYRSERHAQRALQEMRLRAEWGELERREQRIYECRYCLMWHATSRLFGPTPSRG